MPPNRKNGPSFQTGSTQNLILVIGLAVSFIAIVIIIAWIALSNVEEKVQADAGDALQTVLQTTQESLNLSPELIKGLVNGIQEAVEMGDFKRISSIAGDLKSRSKSMIPICNRLIQLAEDFDFDGISKIVTELEDNI
jgi:hypothetical protein